MFFIFVNEAELYMIIKILSRTKIKLVQNSFVLIQFIINKQLFACNFRDKTYLREQKNSLHFAG